MSVGRVRGAHDEAVVVAGDHGVDPAGGELGLDGVEIDAQPERLDEPRASPDDLEHAVVGVEPGEVAGRQLVERRPAGEIGLRRRVPEHHVRAAVDELADAVGQAVDRPQLEVAAGDRPRRSPAGWRAASSGGR